MGLIEARSQAADHAFESYDFGESIVADVNGWDSAGDEWSRIFFLEDEDGGGPSTRETFVVQFRVGEATVTEADWTG